LTLPLLPPISSSSSSVNLLPDFSFLKKGYDFSNG
jgi:hypothetical protein